MGVTELYKFQCIAKTHLAQVDYKVWRKSKLYK